MFHSWFVRLTNQEILYNLNKGKEVILYFKNRYSFVHIVFLLLIFILYQIVGRAFGLFFHENYKLMEIILSIVSSYLMVIVIMSYIYFLLMKTMVDFKKELNISMKNIDILWGILAYLVSFLILLILNYFLPNKSESRLALKIKYLIFHSHYIVITLLFVYGAILAPITEELVFRGYIWKILEKKRLNKYLILLIISLFFALMHFELSIFLQVFVLGIIFGFLRMRTNRLGPSIVAHIITNTLAILLSIVFYLFYA